MSAPRPDYTPMILVCLMANCMLPQMTRCLPDPVRIVAALVPLVCLLWIVYCIKSDKVKP